MQSHTPQSPKHYCKDGAQDTQTHAVRVPLSLDEAVWICQVVFNILPPCHSAPCFLITAAYEGSSLGDADKDFPSMSTVYIGDVVAAAQTLHLDPEICG